MTLRQIQEWEMSFTVKKGIQQGEEEATKIATLKLMEEVGEIAKAILEGEWNEVQAEVADTIVFAAKIANIGEKFHGATPLTEVMQHKMSYCESRSYDKKSKKLDKPANQEFK